MNDSNKPDIEKLLRQMSLNKPPSRLDQKVMQIAAEQSQVTDSKVTPAVGFGWPILGATTVVATLFGLAMGIYMPRIVEQLPELTNAIRADDSDPRLIDSDLLRDVTAFQELHGHSGQEEFKTCSNCHLFDDKDRQVIDKWAHDMVKAGKHHQLGMNCSMCHAGDGLPITDRPVVPHEIPESDLPILPHENPETEHPHGHAEWAFAKCSDCHLVDVTDREILDRWESSDLHEGLHSTFWQDCSMCHVGDEPKQGIGDSRG